MRHFGLILAFGNSLASTVFDDSADGENYERLRKNLTLDNVKVPSQADLEQPNKYNTNTNLDNQFQIRSALDSSLCLTRSRQQKLVLGTCDLGNSQQWFKLSQRGLISNGEQCLERRCDSSDPPVPSFNACNIQNESQAWRFIGTRIESLACTNSIIVQQHSEFKRVYAIPDQFDRGLPQLISNTLTPSVIRNVLGHGCWCAQLAASYSSMKDKANTIEQQHAQDQVRYSQSMIPIDGLDTICRDWMNTRKCVLYKGGACFRQPRQGRYLLALESVNNNIASGLSCLDQHIIPNSTSVACLNDTCRIDVFYISKIREYFDDNQHQPFQKIEIAAENQRDFCLNTGDENGLIRNNRGGGGGTPETSSNGVFRKGNKYTKPKIRVCQGEAPHLRLELQDPPRPNRKVPPIPRL